MDCHRAVELPVHEVQLDQAGEGGVSVGVGVSVGEVVGVGVEVARRVAKMRVAGLVEGVGVAVLTQ